jgi:hypothetical protein
VATRTQATSSSATSTPLSTKIVVWLGVLLVGVGAALAVVDHLRGDPETSGADAAPAATTGVSLPTSGHLLQFVALLVVGVLVVGFFVLTRGPSRKR